MKAGHDDLYQALIDLHAELDAPASAAVNARLILLLAERIGDPAVVLQLIEAAKQPSQP